MGRGKESLYNWSMSHEQDSRPFLQLHVAIFIN